MGRRAVGQLVCGATSGDEITGGGSYGSQTTITYGEYVLSKVSVFRPSTSTARGIQLKTAMTIRRVARTAAAASATPGTANGDVPDLRPSSLPRSRGAGGRVGGGRADSRSFFFFDLFRGNHVIRPRTGAVGGCFVLLPSQAPLGAEVDTAMVERARARSACRRCSGCR